MRVVLVNLFGTELYYDDGFNLKKIIEGGFDRNERVVLDFQRIEFCPHSFLNVAIGELYGKYSSDYIRKNLFLDNMMSDDVALLKRVVTNAKSFMSKQLS